MTNPKLYDVFNITDLRVGMTINLTASGEIHAGNDYVVEGEDEDFGFYITTTVSGTKVYVADVIPGEEVNVLLNDFTWYEIRTHGPTFELFTEDVDGFTEHVWATPAYSSLPVPTEGEEVSSYNISGLNFSGFHIYPGQIDSVIALLEAIKARHNG